MGRVIRNQRYVFPALFSWRVDSALPVESSHHHQQHSASTLFTIIADLFDPTRKGRGSIFTANTRLNKAPAAFRNLDYAEAHGYIRGVIKEIIHG